MINKTFKGFDRYEIAPLGKEGVRDLCAKWYGIVYGESEESRKRGTTLADRITEDVRIFRLARNPLLLTTLLLVERRVGRLPTKRTALYDGATQCAGRPAGFLRPYFKRGTGIGVCGQH